MHVGRVSFCHMEPIGFQEYLLAHGQARLLKTIGDWRPGKDLSAAAHEQAWNWFERFSMVGARISEQMAAQQLRLLDPAGSEEPGLYYWQREGGRPG